jgi:type I restriction enzyme S subunit
MSKKSSIQSGLKPGRRFPGFSDSWEFKELGQYLSEYSERTPGTTDLPIYSSTRSGLKPQKEYYDGKELINDGEYGVVPPRYFVYRHMSDDGTFKFNINKTGERIAVSKEYPVFFTIGLHPEYLLHVINDGVEFARFALAQKKGGTRTRLYFKTLRMWKPLLPSYPEQEKISDCLSSLDELINAEALKLNALKVHQKGLMQHLFPRNGENTPHLRFPEFKSAGQWKKRKISSVLKRVSNPVKVDPDGSYRQIGIRSHGKGIFHKDAVSGVELGNKRVFWVEDNALVINIVFAWEQAVANTSENEKGMIASHRFPMYKGKTNGFDVNFIKYFFLTKKGKELLEMASPGGAGRNKTLGQKEFENLEFLLPETVEEQIRISNCLTSIATRIETQTKKLDVLMSHKKGLMRQLFPIQDEVQR